MKLRTKICLVSVGFLLILSQGVSGVLLSVTTRERLETVFDYEQRIFLDKVKGLFHKIYPWSFGDMTEEMQDRFMKSGSRDHLGLGYAVYREGEEILNLTPYDFEIAEKAQSWNVGEDFRVYKEIQVGNKKLLIHACDFEIAGGNCYQIWHYSDVTDIWMEAQRKFWIGALAALILSGAAGGVLTVLIRHLMVPLDFLRDSANQVAGGQYGIQCPVVRKDEIGEISESFNEMAQKVEEHISLLSETNERQRRLLGNLAHELKTPMTAAIGYSDALLRIDLTPGQREKALRYIGSECRRLSRLSAKMLELTGMVPKEGEIERKEGRIADLLEQVEEGMERRLKEKNLRLEADAKRETKRHLMDEDLMVSLLLNLVDNACKASKEGGIIRVTVDNDKVAVEDQGIGISAEEISKVTEAFYMVDKSRARAAGGAGLGLALCQEIARLHGGRLEITSEEQKGTKVVFWWKQDEVKEKGLK